MNPSIKSAMKIGVSALALSLSAVPIVAQNILSRAQVVGGTDACPAIFISFSQPLTFSNISVIDGGLTVRVNLKRSASDILDSSGEDLIETYPNLILPEIGQVAISMNSGGTDPIVLLRFDAPVSTPIDIVQAGDNSIVLAGISPQGGAICGAAASPQDPLNVETTDAFDLPSEADTSDPELARIEEIYTKARAAITAQEFSLAAQLLTNLTTLPLHARSADAQELLGVVRERNGQFAHAKAEYEIYLETFPDSAGANRVRQRLAALLTAASTPAPLRDAGPGYTGPIDQPVRGAGIRSIPRAQDSFGFADEEEEETFSASLSSYYYLNQGSTTLAEFDTDTTTSDSDVYNNSLVTSLEMSDTVEFEGGTLDWRVGGDYALDLEDSADNRFRISLAYGEVVLNDSDLVWRLGRQTRYGGGIFGRFDGALLTWPAKENMTLTFTAGMPVNFTADGLFASDKLLFGASVEMAELIPGLTASAYLVHQSNGSFTDRQAIGLEAQYQNETISGFALADYDFYFGQLNTARISGTKIFDDQSSLTLSFDTSRSPLLSLANALQGQTETTLDGLSGFYTIDEINQFALDRAATTRSATVVYSAPITDVWMASLTGSVFHTSDMPGSGGVAELLSTGPEYYFSAQMVGNNIFSERDVVSVSGRYSQTSASTLILLDGYRRYQVSDDIRLNTRLKLGQRAIASSDGTELFAIPSINMTYMTNETFDLEFEVGGRISTLTTPLTTESSRELFMLAGFSKQF